MKTLVETSLFNLFASYTNGAGPAAGELSAAYNDFVNCLATLSSAGDLTGQLRRLNYTKIELAFMRQACNGMAEDCRNILYDVFIDKTLALLDAEAEILKEMLRHGTVSAGFHAEAVRGSGRKTSVTLTWNGTDSDLIELVAALMATGAIGTTEGQDLKNCGCYPRFRGSVPSENQCAVHQAWQSVRPLYGHHSVHRLLRKSYNRMLDARLA